MEDDTINIAVPCSVQTDRK